VEIRNGLFNPPEEALKVVEWNGYSLFAPAYTQPAVFANSTHVLS